MEAEISIVLPVYNGEKYLRQSLDSILAQSFTAWELIVVNDCSTDSTVEIVGEYTKQDKRIRVINNPHNLRLPASLNVGFKVAQGKYFTWTSDDNIFHPNALEKMWRVLENDKKIGFVYAAMETIDEEGIVQGQYNDLIQSELQDEEYLFYNNCVGACFMYRQDVAREIGEYDVDLFGAEDYDYWLRIAEKYPIRYINEILYSYRRHDKQLSVTKKQLVYEQDCKLKKKHLPCLVQKFKKKPQVIIRLFLEFVIKWQGDFDWAMQEAKQYFPDIVRLQKCLADEKIVLFGAGNIGKQAKAFFADKAAAFVDNDLSKVGTMIDELPVISATELKSWKGKVVVATALKAVPEIVMQLNELGIKEYSVYQLLKVQNLSDGVKKCEY